MLKASKTWDVRCPMALARMFPVRRGYYYKVDRMQARKIVSILSRAYNVTVPTILEETPKGCNGWYQVARPRNTATHRVLTTFVYGKIAVHARGHMKTVFHEWYHHLDAATGGKYDSDDRKQLAWEFADRLFDKLRQTKV